MNARYVVQRRLSFRFAIIDTTTGAVVEGGFFDRHAAEQSCARWNHDAAWVPCPCCDEWLCTIHGGHVATCACPPIDQWTTDPYTTR